MGCRGGGYRGFVQQATLCGGALGVPMSGVLSRLWQTFRVASIQVLRVKTGLEAAGGTARPGRRGNGRRWGARGGWVGGSRATAVVFVGRRRGGYRGGYHAGFPRWTGCRRVACWGSCERAESDRRYARSGGVEVGASAGGGGSLEILRRCRVSRIYEVGGCQSSGGVKGIKLRD